MKKRFIKQGMRSGIVLLLALMLAFPLPGSLGDFFERTNLVAAAQSGISPEITEQDNLLSNGSFESWDYETHLPENWLWFRPQGTPTINADSTVVKEGDTSVRIEATATARTSVNQYVRDIMPNHTYTLTYWMKTDQVASASLGTALRLQFFDEDGVKIGGNHMPDRHLKGTNDWTKVTYSFKTPANTDRLLLDFFLWEATGTVWFDHAELVAEAAWSSPNVLDAFNASFDMGDASGRPLGWATFIPTGTPQIVIDEHVKHHGTASMKITAETLTRADVNRRLPITADQMYYLTFWLKTDDVVSSENNGGATMRFQLFDAANQKIGGNYHVNYTKGTTDWTQYTYAFHAPANTTTILIEPFMWNATGTVWYDDIRLEAAGALADRISTAHPRLLADAGKFDERFGKIELGSEEARIYAEVKQQADVMLTQPASEYVIPDGVRLLDTSRRVVNRIYTLGIAYQMEQRNNPAAASVYAQRAWTELSAAAAFPNWNPSHFLDTAEMTHAFAIGYDWFYDYWSEAQKATIREAIVTHGLEPGMEHYRTGWWPDVVSNWNFVCNAGLMAGALVIGDQAEYRELADTILRNGLITSEKAFAQFDPHGGWYEGPGYWDYATQYLTVFLGGLQTVLGTDFGYSERPGVKDTGYFPIYFESPTGQNFNFSDAGSGIPPAPQLLWMSDAFDRPAYQWFRPSVRPSPQSFLWYERDNNYGGPRAEQLPTDKYFEYVETVAMRSAWEDKQAIYLGIKGAVEDTSHKQLDAGEFVFDALGVRWGMLLGSDNYNLPGYFDVNNRRWAFYRNRSEGSNTIVINPGTAGEQDKHASAKVERFETSPSETFAIVDLTPVMGEEVISAKRGLKLTNDRRYVILQDEVYTDTPSEVWWFMHTQTTIETISNDGKTAIMQHNGQRLWARILSTQGEFVAMDAVPLPSSPDPAGQNQNLGTTKLAIHAEEVTQLQWSVLMVPLRAWEEAPSEWPTVEDLSQWQVPVEAPPTLSTLTVDAQPLASFASHVFSYDLPAPQDGVPPVVAATAASGTTVSIEQAAQMPGTAWITVQETPNGAKTRYAVHFQGKMEEVESLPVVQVTSSSDDGNLAENTLDGDYNTRWSSEGNGQWIQFDLGSSQTVRTISTAWFNGNTRKANYSISISDDGIQWEPLYTGQSSGLTTLLEHHDIGTRSARYVRITGYGNTANAFNSLTEVRIYAVEVEDDLPSPGLRRVEVQALGLDISGTLHLQDSVTLAVYGYDAEDQPVDLSEANLRFISSDPQIAKVDASGQLSALSEGSVRITVWIEQDRVIRTGYVQITVSDPQRRYAQADAYVRGGDFANRNYGNEGLVIKAASNPTYERLSYLKFDVSGIPQEAEQVLLYLYGYTQDNNGTHVMMSAHGVADDDWEEMTIVHANRPLVGAELDSVAFDQVAGWRTLDVTAFVKGEAAGDGIATIALQQNIAEGLATLVNSREATTNQPSLFYTLSEATEPPVTYANVHEDRVTSLQNGWYTAPVTVNLVTDETVTETVYSLDEGANWSLYQAPIRFDRDGEYELRYYSRNTSGIAEVPKQLDVRVDQTPPQATIRYVANGEAVIAYVEADEPITVLNNDGHLSHAFYFNGNFLFELMDRAGQRSSVWASVNDFVHASSGAPARPDLSDDNGHDTGLQDGSYTITTNIWWGDQARIYELYENGMLIDRQILPDDATGWQQISTAVSGRINGTYTYEASLSNTHGTTRSLPHRVTVAHATPGIPQLSDDNWDGDGDYSVTMHMWWGTNGERYDLYENGILIDTQSLSAASPQAQRTATQVAGRSPGLYTYMVELSNGAGASRSEPHVIEVRH